MGEPGPREHARLGLMRLILALSLAMMFASALAGCGESEAPKSTPAAAESEEPASKPPPKKRPAPPPAKKPAPAPVTAPAAPPPPEYALDDTLRLNQVQMKGTHNSYHVRPEKWNSSAWEFDMPPLADQASKWGVRAFELDVHWSNARFEVYHWPVDPGTKCLELTLCIDQLRGWSTAHPGHLPIFVFFDLKYDETGDTVFNHLEDLEWLLTDRWPREKVFTPDDLRGSSANLRSAVREHGWPTLGAVRGKVIFVMLAAEDVLKRYAWNDTSLDGRRMFPATGNTGWPHAAVIDFDDVLKYEGLVRGAVNAGFVVRTRGDDIPTMGEGDYPLRWRTALATGAQLVMTDYPIPNSIEGHDTSIPGGTPARCNPRTAPAECRPEALENPGRLVLPYP